jgi:hypothetical protein
VTEDRRFSLLIGDLFALFNRAAKHVQTDPVWVSATSRRALAVLRAYRPADDGQAILIETAIEQYEELLRKAGHQ